MLVGQLVIMVKVVGGVIREGGSASPNPRIRIAIVRVDREFFMLVKDPYVLLPDTTHLLCSVLFALSCFVLISKHQLFADLRCSIVVLRFICCWHHRYFAWRRSSLLLVLCVVDVGVHGFASFLIVCTFCHMGLPAYFQIFKQASLDVRQPISHEEVDTTHLLVSLHSQFVSCSVTIIYRGLEP